METWYTEAKYIVNKGLVLFRNIRLMSCLDATKELKYYNMITNYTVSQKRSLR